MKKKRFMGLLALASCVTLLTGCESDALWGLGGKWNQVVDWGKGLLGLKKDEQKEEKESKQSEEQEEEQTPDQRPAPQVKISFAELPEKVLVGGSIDLDNYVSVSGTNEDFAVTIAAACSEIASVEGHVISVLDEGEVQFTVSAAGKSESASFNGMCELRDKLVSAFEGVGNEYAMIEASDSSPDTLIHGHGYLESQYWEEDNEGNPLPGGFMQFDDLDGVYPFVIYEGQVESTTYQIYMNEYLEYFNGDFSVDFSEALRTFDTDLLASGDPVEVLQVSGADARKFVENSCLHFDGEYELTIPAGYFGFTEPTEATGVASKVDFLTLEYKPDGLHSVDFADACIFVDLYVEEEYEVEPAVLDDEQNVVTPAVMGTRDVLVQADVLLAEYYISGDPLITGDPIVEEFLSDPSNRPEGADLASMFGLSDFFAAIPDYKTGYLEAEYGWFDKSAQAFAEGVPEDTGAWGPFASLPGYNDTIRAYNENAVLEFDDQLNLKGGLIQHENSVYSLEYQVDPETMEESLVPEATSLESAYSDDAKVFADLAEAGAWNDELYYNYGSGSTPYGTLYRLMGNLYRSASLLRSLLGGFSEFKSFLMGVDEYIDIIDFLSYFELSKTDVIFGINYISFDFSLSWSTKYDYNFSLTLYAYSTALDSTVESVIEAYFPSQVDPGNGD